MKRQEESCLAPQYGKLKEFYKQIQQIKKKKKKKRGDYEKKTQHVNKTLHILYYK